MARDRDGAVASGLPLNEIPFNEYKINFQHYPPSGRVGAAGEGLLCSAQYWKTLRSIALPSRSFLASDPPGGRVIEAGCIFVERYCR